MNKSKWVEWWATRGAEFQFGGVIQGWFQWLLFIPVYFKMYKMTLMGTLLLIIGFTFLRWLFGWISYRMKFVEHFRRKEFKGILK